MDKKVIIGVVAGVVALGIIITAIIGISTKFTFKFSDNDSKPAGTLPGSSQTDSAASSGTSSTASEVIIKKGDLSIPTVKTEKGKNVSIPINLEKNPGIFAGQFYFEYDTNALTYVDYTKGDILDEFLVNEKDGTIGCIINASGAEDITASGTLITLNFTVKDNAPAGDYEIKVGENTMLCNFKEQTVEPKIASGKVTVK